MSSENQNSEAENFKKQETESPAEEVKPDVEVVEKQQEDFKAKYYYLAAEFDNFRKRAEKERDNLLKYGAEKILNDLIEVVDNFERTLDMLSVDQDQKVKNIVEGLMMVRKLFLSNLSKHGLDQLEVVGKDFDPNFHEAMGQEYCEGIKPNEIVKDYQHGYTLNGRLLRASKVIVASDKQ